MLDWPPHCAFLRFKNRFHYDNYCKNKYYDNVSLCHSVFSISATAFGFQVKIFDNKMIKCHLTLSCNGNFQTHNQSAPRWDTAIFVVAVFSVQACATKSFKWSRLLNKVQKP